MEEYALSDIVGDRRQREEGIRAIGEAMKLEAGTGR